MKKLSLLLAVMAAFVSSALFAVAPTDFKMKLPITVNAAAVGEKSATDLPVLVRLSESIDGFKYSDLTSVGSDLAFGVDDGSSITVYPHEIDTWNPEGESLVWVKVPVLSASTAFNMYYGNGASDGATASATWSNYAGVWHLNELEGDGGTTALKVSNSTSNGAVIDGEAFGGTVGVSGMIGGARRISDAEMNSGKAAGEKKGGIWIPGDQDCTKFGGTFTISAWFYHKNQKYYWDHMFHKKTASNASEGGLAVEVNSGGPSVDIYGGNSVKLNASIGLENEKWLYVTLVFSGTTCNVYANGAYVAQKTNIGTASDSTKRWVLGNDVDGYGGVDGDISWKGSIDEARLSGIAFSADYLALEYAAMADSDFLAMGEVQTMDPTMPKFSSMTVTANATAGFDVSFVLAEGAGTLKAVLTDVADSQLSFESNFNGGEEISAAGDYSTTVTGMSVGHTYECAIVGESRNGTPVRAVVGSVYNGEVKIERVNDADETDMSSGFFKVSLVDAGVTVGSDIAVAYTIGGTAVPGETYEEIEDAVTIPVGKSEALVEIIPIYSDSVDEDVDVTLTLNPGPYQIGEPSSATVVVKNSSVNPYVRYVSTTGDDANNGLTIGSAKATLQAAIDSLDEFSADNDCTVYVAPGEYPQPKNDIFYCVYVRGRITITSTTGVAADVTISRDANVSNVAVFSLENEGARLSKITISGGQLGSNNDAKKGPQKGGGVYLGNGVVEDCIVTGCVGPAHNQAGVGIYINAGRVSRCRVLSCNSNNDEAQGTGVYVANGGLLEDSFVANCSCKKGGAVLVEGGGKVVNCTIVKNTGLHNAGVRVTANTAQIVNCAIFGNTQTHTQTGNVYTEGYGACFVNCAADEEIVDGVNCIKMTPAFRDWENGDYYPTAGSPCLDAGALRSTYGCVSESDLDGNPRAAGTVDIGCFENQKDVAEVGFVWSIDRFVLPAKVSLVADSIAIDSPSYTWTFHNDTTGEELSDSGASCTLDLAEDGAGMYMFSVTAGGKTFVSPTKLLVSQPTLYVKSGNAGAQFPYATDATAAATIADAVAAAGVGATVYVAPGEYPISSPIEVYKGISVLGTGRKYTDVVVTNTVSGTQTDKRIFKLQDKDAFIANLTMSGGVCANANDGGNLYCYGKGGTVSNCLLTAGTAYAQYQQGSGAAYLTAGLLTHCEITKCNAIPAKGQPCTRIVNVASGRMSNCLIHDCDFRTGGDNALRGAGSLINIAASGIMDNCTVCDVVVSNASPVVYVGVAQGGFDKGAKVVNCVIFGKDQDGAVLNPMAGNTAYNTPLTVCFRGCATKVPIQITYETKTQNLIGTYTADESNIVVDPEDCFVDAANGDFRPLKEGSLVDKGVTTGPGSSTFALALPKTDLAGNPRVVGSSVDIGCYEVSSAVRGLMILFR